MKNDEERLLITWGNNSTEAKMKMFTVGLSIIKPDGGINTP